MNWIGAFCVLMGAILLFWLACAKLAAGGRK